MSAKRGLKGLVIPTTTIKVPGGEIAVRGLSFNDLSVLVQGYGPALKGLFEKLTGSGLEDVSLDDAGKFAMALLETVPEAAACIIALGAGEPDDVAVAATLPFPVQLEALEAVAVLTFNTEGGAKKVVETVIRLAQGIGGLMADLKA
jgi:hypothetical protein